MTFHATEWEWDASKAAIPDNPITICEARQMDGTLRYAVRQAGACLNKSGEWEFEPMPSSRDARLPGPMPLPYVDRCGKFDSQVL